MWEACCELEFCAEEFIECSLLKFQNEVSWHDVYVTSSIYMTRDQISAITSKPASMFRLTCSLQIARFLEKASNMVTIDNTMSELRPAT